MKGYVRFTYFATRKSSDLYLMAQVIDEATHQVQHTYATFDHKPSERDIEWCSTSEVHSNFDVEEARDFLEHCHGLKAIEPCYK